MTISLEKPQGDPAKAKPSGRSSDGKDSDGDRAQCWVRTWSAKTT